jgi:hypothetical protein
MTADTVCHEGEVNFKESDIKETQLQGFDMWALNKNLK